jgi:hypothetical protein
MDDAMRNAITAVRLDDETTRERWFETMCTTHAKLAEADDPDWEKFTSSLTEKALSAGISADTVEQFVRHMNDTDMAPLETIAKLRDRATELPALYREHAADTDDQDGTDNAAGADEAYDESAWNAFLAEHGAYWNGDDSAWDQFTTWFHYQAEQNNLAKPARDFIGYVESQTDKVAVFAAYGISIPKSGTGAGETAQDGAAAHEEPDLSQFPEVKHGDSGEWVDYLDAMLTRHGF